MSSPLRWYEWDSRFIAAHHQPAVLLDLALSRGIDSHALLRGSGLFYEDIASGRARVSPAQLLTLIGNAERLLGAADSSFLFGQRLLPGHYGEVSLALAGVAADSLSQMIPGLLGGNQAQNLLSSQRQRMIQQIEADLDNTLLYVYRELSDAELEEYVQFAQSEDGKAYYQAALKSLRAGLAVGMSGAELEPQQGI